MVGADDFPRCRVVDGRRGCSRSECLPGVVGLVGVLAQPGAEEGMGFLFSGTTECVARRTGVGTKMRGKDCAAFFGLRASVEDEVALGEVAISLGDEFLEGVGAAGVVVGAACEVVGALADGTQFGHESAGRPVVHPVGKVLVVSRCRSVRLSGSWRTGFIFADEKKKLLVGTK